MRQAILDANATPGVADEIVFQAGLTGTINLTTGEMDVTDDLTLTGNGRANTIIDAQSNSRIFDVSGFGTDLTLDSLTLRNGRTTANGEAGGRSNRPPLGPARFL